MTKTEAAEYLGMSERSLERYTKDNKIGVTYERGKTKPVPIYDQGELDRFKTELEKPVHRPAVEKMPTANDNGATSAADSGAIQLARSEEFLQVIENVISATAREVAKAMTTANDKSDNKRQEQEVPISERVFLSVDEGASLLGISKGALEKAIKADEIKVYRELARGRRVKRADLKKWADKR